MDISGEDNRVFHIQFHSGCLLQFNSNEFVVLLYIVLFQEVITYSYRRFSLEILVYLHTFLKETGLVFGTSY